MLPAYKEVGITAYYWVGYELGYSQKVGYFSLDELKELHQKIAVAIDELSEIVESEKVLG